MMISPLFSELPPDLADDSAWRVCQASRDTPAPGRSHAEDFKIQVLAAQSILNRMAHRLLRNAVWTEDAASETVVAALQSPRNFAGQSQLRVGVGLKRIQARPRRKAVVSAARSS
jgi:hypothetical protein